jgi:hypothetical protein
MSDTFRLNAVPIEQRLTEILDDIPKRDAELLKLADTVTLEYQEYYTTHYSTLEKSAAEFNRCLLEDIKGLCDDVLRSEGSFVDNLTSCVAYVRNLVIIALAGTTSDVLVHRYMHKAHYALVKCRDIQEYGSETIKIASCVANLYTSTSC